MAFMKTNTVDITVGGTTYNSLDDFGLAIQNTDYIGTPFQDYTNMVVVPGRDGVLDLTDTVFGKQYFQYRPIEIYFGGMETPEEWDSVISTFRNLFEGRIVKLAFATDPDWYWTGRCSIDAFEHKRALGTFTFRIPYADPVKYKDISETVGAVQAGTDVTLDLTYGRAVPVFTSTGSFTVSFNGETFSFDSGTHKDAGLVLTEGENELTLTGNNVTVAIAYKDRSL